jgi:hypothetical protein
VKTQIIEELEQQVIAEGFRRGTEEFENRMVYLKVQKCQEMLNTTCSECDYQFMCPLTERLHKITLLRKEKEKAKKNG